MTKHLTLFTDMKLTASRLRT